MPFARAADIDILAVPIEGCAGGGLHVGIWTPLGGVKTGSMDIAILIHGGGFSMGDYQDIPTTDVEYYNKEGFVVVSPQYRLAPQYVIYTLAVKLPCSSQSNEPLICAACVCLKLPRIRLVYTSGSTMDSSIMSSEPEASVKSSFQAGQLEQLVLSSWSVGLHLKSWAFYF